MADTWSNPYDAGGDDDQLKSGDTWKSVKAGVQSGIVQPVLAGGRALAEDAGADNLATVMKNLGISSQETEKEDVDEMSPAGKRGLQAAVTSPDFWSHPLRSAGLKAANMSPALAATVVPGGLMSDALMAARAAAVAGGAINAGSVLKELYDKTDALPDDKLRGESQYYDTLRTAGMDEKEARTELNSHMRGMAGPLNFVIGTAAGMIGPAAGAARGLKGGSAVIGGEEAGLAARTVGGAGEGAIGMGVQSGAANATVQNAAMGEGLQKDFDNEALVEAITSGSMFGALAGGPIGAAFKGKVTDKSAEAAGPGPKGYGTGNASKPVETAEVGNPDSAPTRSDKNYPKAEAAKATSKNSGVTEAGPLEPDVAQAAALDAKQDQPQAAQVPPDVAAASQRVAAAQPEPVPRPAPEPEAVPMAARDGAAPVPDVVADRPVPDAGQARPAEEAERIQSPAVRSKAGKVFTGLNHGLAAEEAKNAGHVVGNRMDADGFLTSTGRYVGRKEAYAIADRAAQIHAGTETPERPYLTAHQVLDEHGRPVTPEVTEPGKPRILPDLTQDPEQVAAFTKQGTDQVRKNIADAEPKEVGTKHRSVDEQAKIQDDALAAKDLFDAHTPEEVAIPKTAAERELLRQRLDTISKAADEAGIEVPTKVAGRADHIVWLREVKNLAKKLSQKGFTGAKANEHITSFLAREKAAKSGDFSVMRGERASEGDAAMRVSQGDVEAKAAAGTDFEKEGVETKVSKTSRGPVRDSRSEEQAASPVRKVALTDEAKQAAIKALELAQRRAAAREAEAPVEAPAPTTVKQKIAAAAKKVDTEPSAAQKESGNYAKGHVAIHGLDITIENPRGSKRSGVDANGKPWEVTLPDHYGYIKRTEGADGDHVDTYIGKHPESDHAFVIDQVDPETRKFDEHKVMLGYNNAAQAMDAYERAFSDGRAAERVGAFTHMPVEDLKGWLKNGDTKKSVKSTPAEDHAIMEALREGGPSIPSKHAPEGVQPAYTMTAREALAGLDFSHLEGVPKALANFFRDRMADTVGDTPVHILSEKDMARLNGEELGSPDGSVGTHVLYLGGEQSRVLLRADKLSTPKNTAHVVMHELAHALTSRALFEKPELHEAVSMMMRETKDFLKDVPDLAKQLSYAMTNPREFIAEAFSNPKVQEILAHVPVSEELAGKLNLDHPVRGSVWQAITNMVRGILEKATGHKFPAGTRMIEAVMRLGDNAEHHAKYIDYKTRAYGPQPMQMHGLTDKLVDHLRKDVEGKINEMLRRPEMQGQDAKPWLLKGRTLDSLAQAGDRFFGRDTNPVRKFADAVEMVRTTAEHYVRDSEPVVTKLFELQKKYQGNPVWDAFTKLVHDETLAGVHADVGLDHAKNAHLGKDRLHSTWSKAQHPELASQYEALPQDLKDVRAEAMKFFTDQQNALSLGIIKNRVLAALGIKDDELANRIHEGKTTDADKALLGDAHDTIMEAKELAKVKGPYFPLMRRGDHVVSAEQHLPTPAGAKRISDTEFEFPTREAATSYAKKSKLEAIPESVWVDKNTGDTHFPVDPAEPDRAPQKVLKEDTDAEQRFRVTVKNKHVEFVDGEKAARVRAAELEKAGLKASGVQERRAEIRGSGDMAPGQLQTLLRSLEMRKGFQDMHQVQQHELRQALNQAQIRMMGSTRIQSRALPRTNVLGYSHELTANTLDYARATAGYRAKLDHAPVIEKALKDIETGSDNDYGKHTSLGRSSLANEIKRRAATFDAYEGSKINPYTKHLMTASFLDKLMSPAHSVINALQPTMVTMPVLAGRHGVGRSFAAMSKAYSDIGAGSVVKGGVKSTLRKGVDPNHEGANFLGDIMGRIKDPRERDMLKYLAARGSIDPEAGFEVGKMVKARDGVVGKIDTGIGYMEGIARQMPKAIEAINRTVTALAAYRLEMARTGNHENAMRYAQETVNNTQFLYSPTNTPPMFNHPLAKLVLQFKKYGQAMYQLVGQEIGKAYRNASPGDRAEAIKTLTGIVATHAAFAGTLGLPTEPLKYLLMGAQAAGLTSTGWSDVEQWERKTAAGLLGNTAGELVTRGLPRALGVDLSSRVGADSWTSFGEPKSNKDTDVKAWLFDTLAGAPLSLVGDWVKGANAIAAGDFEKAGELMIPVKAIADSMRAYRQATEGKKSGSGRETLSAYSPMEAATRAFGFTPRREAEAGSATSAAYKAQESLKIDRSTLMQTWVTAKPTDKATAMKEITKFNQGKTGDERITMAQLTSALRRRDQEKAKNTVVNGVSTTKQGRRAVHDAVSPYNL